MKILNVNFGFKWLVLGALLMLAGCSEGNGIPLDKDDPAPPDPIGQNDPAPPPTDPINTPDPDPPVVDPDTPIVDITPGGLSVKMANEPAYTFKMKVWDETYLDGGQAESFEMTWVERAWMNPDSPYVQNIDPFSVTISVKDAVGLKALFFELEYDTTRLQPSEVYCADPVDGPGHFMQLPLRLGRPNVTHPDTLEYGMAIINYEDSAGFTGTGELMTITFGLTVIDLYPEEKEAIHPPERSWRRYEMELDTTTNMLSWLTCLRGDYNLDGKSTILDIIPLWNYHGYPAGVLGTQQALTDGDNNGEVNIHDMIPVIIDFLHRVDGYNVYGGLPATYPDGGELLSWVPTSDAVVDLPFALPSFAYEIADPQPGMLYWVKSTLDEQVGGASESISIE